MVIELNLSVRTHLECDMTPPHDYSLFQAPLYMTYSFCALLITEYILVYDFCMASRSDERQIKILGKGGSTGIVIDCGRFICQAISMEWQCMPG